MCLDLKIIRLSFSYDVIIMNLNASCDNHTMGLFCAFKYLEPPSPPQTSAKTSLCRREAGEREKERDGRWEGDCKRNTISSHRPPRACCFSIIFVFLLEHLTEASAEKRLQSSQILINTICHSLISVKALHSSTEKDTLELVPVDADILFRPAIRQPC